MEWGRTSRADRKPCPGKSLNAGLRRRAARLISSGVTSRSSRSCSTLMILSRNLRFSSPLAANYIPMMSFRRTFINWPGQSSGQVQVCPSASPKTSDQRQKHLFSEHRIEQSPVAWIQQFTVVDSRRFLEQGVSLRAAREVFLGTPPIACTDIAGRTVVRIERG